MFVHEEGLSSWKLMYQKCFLAINLTLWESLFLLKFVKNKHLYDEQQSLVRGLNLWKLAKSSLPMLSNQKFWQAKEKVYNKELGLHFGNGNRPHST